jgi:putative hydrolase of the HAD superfamily
MTRSCNRIYGVKAIFFDLDDTLYFYVDGEKGPLHGPSSVYARDKVFSYLLDVYPHLEREDLLSTYEKIVQNVLREEAEGSYDAWNLRKRFSKLLLDLGLNDDELVKRLAAIYANTKAVFTKPCPDTYDVLSNLREKYVLGIITNGPSDLQREMISALRLEKYFSYIFISEEVGFRKPAKEIFQTALKKVACRSEEAVMVGDSLSEDIKPAKKLGMETVLLDPKNKFKKEDLALEERPDYLIRQFTELLNLY